MGRAENDHVTLSSPTALMTDVRIDLAESHLVQGSPVLGSLGRGLPGLGVPRSVCDWGLKVQSLSTLEFPPSVFSFKLLPLRISLASV